MTNAHENPAEALKVVSRREARVPLELKKIGLSSDEKMRELYKKSGGSGCLYYSRFIEKILYYGCQRYEYDILPVELCKSPVSHKEPCLNDEYVRSGDIIHCPTASRRGSNPRNRTINLTAL